MHECRDTVKWMALQISFRRPPFSEYINLFKRVVDALLFQGQTRDARINAVFRAIEGYCLFLHDLTYVLYFLRIQATDFVTSSSSTAISISSSLLI